MRKALLFFVAGLLAVWLVSCSGDKPAGQDVAGTGEAQQGATDSLSKPVPPKPRDALPDGPYAIQIEPGRAFRTSTLELTTKGIQLEEAHVVWLLNGKPVSTPRLRHFDITELDVRKGDTVQARVEMNDREVLSNIVEIRNSLPELTSVKLIPEVFGPGDTIGIEADARDADGEPVTVEYEWTLNEEPAGRGKHIGAPLKRGDSFSVTVTPFDGEEYGEKITLRRSVENIPPVLVQHGEYAFDGKEYSYSVKASDPDGDKLKYALKSGPEGMSIDPASGRVKWAVPPDFVGTAAFTVEASDGHGGQAEMTLKFTLAEEKGEKEK